VRGLVGMVQYSTVLSCTVAIWGALEEASKAFWNYLNRRPPRNATAEGDEVSDGERGKNLAGTIHSLMDV
jgi:hypothetical protein